MTRPLSCAETPTAEIVEIAVRGRSVEVDWGYIDQFGSGAYWVDQTRRRGATQDYRLGETLAEEVAACILGGHGIPAEIGLAAFSRLRDRGHLRPPVKSSEILRCLREPLTLEGRQRPVRYRFAKQRAARVSAALEVLNLASPPTDPIALRQFLLDLPGIGFKTASWIVRNWTGSSSVAIIDIHIHRAGVAAGFFSPQWRLPRDYELFEEAFCAAATVGEVSAAALDACIWAQMKALGPAHRYLLNTHP